MNATIIRNNGVDDDDDKQLLALVRERIGCSGRFGSF